MKQKTGIKWADGAQFAADRWALQLVPTRSVLSHQNVCTLYAHLNLSSHIYISSPALQSNAPFCKVAISFPLSEMATV